MRHPALLLLVATAVAASTACGGAASSGSGTGTGSGSSAVVVDGAFSGTYTIKAGSPVALMGAVAAGGIGYFVDSTGFFFVLPKFAADGTLAGAGTEYPPPGQAWVGNAPPLTFAASTTGNPATSFGGTFTSANNNATFNLAALAIPNLTLANVAGNYVGVESTGTAQAVVTVGANGALAGTDGDGCELDGTLAPASDGLLLQVSVADGNPGGSCIGLATGLGFESAQDFMGLKQQGYPGPYLYLGAYGTANGILLELAAAN